MNKMNITALFLFVLFASFDAGRVNGHKNDKEKSLLPMKRSVSPTCKFKKIVEEVEEEVEENRIEIRQIQRELKETREELGKKIDKVLGKMNSICKTPKQGKDCADLYSNGVKKSGIYKINPDGFGNFKVFCDMKTSGGGWTVFQRRLDGSVDFYRGWQDYKHGFGDLRGEFWLGLDKIHRLTTHSKAKLRIDMEDTSGNTRYAEYDYFAVTGEKQKYKLSLGTYAGTAGDSFTGHKGSSFTTKDSDNDKWSGNCAVSFKGGWWYSSCHSSNLNGQYLHGKHSSYANGINWYAWKKHHYSLKSTSMKIRPQVFGLKK